MEEMTDLSPKDPEPSLEEERAFAEAAERAKRSQAWLEGVLSGGPLPAEASKGRRKGLTTDGVSEQNPVDDTEDLPAVRPERIEDSLMNCRRRIRERREFAGKPPLELAEGERERRSTQIRELIQTDRAAGSELTPLHLVLAARYIEGEMDFEDYSIAILRL
jgi:hypothetical protein